jgi:Tfp pilus assembly protein PilZ
MERSSERRVFERMPARFPTRFRDSSPDFGIDVFLKDVSASGAHITTKEQLYLGDIISLEILLPDGLEPILLSGRVRWIRQVAPRVFEAGIEFHKIDLIRLHRLVRYAIEASQN